MPRLVIASPVVVVQQIESVLFKLQATLTLALQPLRLECVQFIESPAL
jgi:hypothetical protein